MIDGNLNALNKYEIEQDKQELACESMLVELGDTLKRIEELIEYCYTIAENYDGYDFTEDLMEEFKALI